MKDDGFPIVDVTVVMPCYNRSGLIVRALESIRAQALWPQQVIVVDDASTDDSVATVRAWADQTRFPVVVEALARNGGAANARNRGIELATTAYVAFLDSDDEHIGDALAKLVAALEANPNAVVAFGDGIKVTPNERIPNAMFLSKVDMAAECLALDQATPRFLLRDPKSTMLNFSLIATCASCFRRADALAVGGMPTHLRTGEDWMFWLKLTDRGDFVYVPENLACVHRHAGNLTHPGSAAETSRHKLVGFTALLDGSAGVAITPAQRARLDGFARTHAALLRYQSSQLGLSSYLRSLRNLPAPHRKGLFAHIVEDPKSMVRAMACSVRPAPAPEIR